MHWQILLYWFTFSILWPLNLKEEQLCFQLLLWRKTQQGKLGHLKKVAAMKTNQKKSCKKNEINKKNRLSFYFFVSCIYFSFFISVYGFIFSFVYVLRHSKTNSMAACIARPIRFVYPSIICPIKLCCYSICVHVWRKTSPISPHPFIGI